MNKIKTTLYSILAGVAICSTMSMTRVYAWDSNASPNVLDTHKMIAEQGVKCVEHDLDANESAKFKENLNILTKYMTTYKNGAVAPDFGTLGKDKDYGMYQDHFYDADEDANFTAHYPYPFYQIYDTAESQCRNYMSQAVAMWQDGKYEEASYALGKAMHYMADLNEPHHASNVIAGPDSPHAPFEAFAEKIKDKYKIDSLGYSTSQGEYASSKNYEYFTDFITAQSQKYARTSKGVYNKYGKMSNSWGDWDTAVKETMPNAQKDVASLIYSFLNEVSSDKKHEKPAELGRFHVVISTADEKDAGTNDYIYFGMELNNGKKYEFNCDLPGDDFEQGYKTAYQFNIPDKDFDLSQVKNVWVRKAKFGAGDAWKIKDLEVYIKGERVLNKNINQWLSGNTTYNIPVNGLWQ